MRKISWLPILIAIALLTGIIFLWDSSENKTEPQTYGLQVDSSLDNLKTEKPIAARQNNMEKPTDITIDPQKNYQATLTTTKGDIVIDLLEKEVPITVNNFVYLSENKFYDQTIFHRVIKGFMIQGGDPKGDGTGGPGYRFEDEKLEGEYTRGTVAMANAGPDTNGSQFFIMHEDYALPNNYVIFGRVVEGMEVVDAIAESEVTTSSVGEASMPVEPTVVKAVVVESK